MTEEQMKELLQQVLKATLTATWTMDLPPPSEAGKDARCYTGRSPDGWRILTLNWKTEAGSGFSGSAADLKHGMVITLPVEIAEIAWQTAHEKLGS